jgi:Tannase and feruloyl esterase
MNGIRRTVAQLPLILALAIAGGEAMSPNSASAKSAPPACSTLAAKLLGGDIKYANSQIVPANTTPAPQAANFTGATPSESNIAVAYCLVVLSYSAESTAIQAQNITIYVGLPLNTTDGGTTGSTVDPPWNFTTVQGNWNGRTEAIGGGVCTGNTNVTGPVPAGFVGSGTDGGHGGNNANSPLDDEPYSNVPLDDPSNTCEPGIVRINGKNEVNAQFITDFYTNGPVQEVIWSKKVATLYYGMAPRYNYWNGCSTGGHQGYAVAEAAPGELQGILASSPGIYEERFTTAQMWGQIAMFDIADEVIAGGKLAAVQNAAIAACDGNDGVVDGIIDDPRTCTFNASANLCGASTAPAAPNCLTQAEVDAVNIIWDGPRNEVGNRIWFPIDRGTDFSIWDGNVPFQAGYVHLGYALINPAYYNAGSFPASYPGYWGNIALNADFQSIIPGAVTNYAAVAQAGSQNVADLTDNADNLDGFKAAGGKLVSFVGGNDQLIMPRGVINYYRGMAQRYALNHDTTGFEGVQRFYRLFHAPGVGHCGLGVLSHGSLGPWPQGGVDFDAVIDWVENGNPPNEVIGSGNTAAPAYVAGAATTLTRPLCPYPQTAVYLGSGSVTAANNWTCGGNLEKNLPIQVGTAPPTPIPGAKPVPCYDVLAKYKDELRGPLDYAASGVDPKTCH